MPVPLTIWDFILLPFYLVIIYFVSNGIKNKNIESNPIYKYYLPGLWFKIFGGIFLTSIYLFYYDGGDTLFYFKESLKFNNLFYERPIDYLRILFTGFTVNDCYNYGSAYIFDFSSDKQVLFMIRIVSPFLFVSFQSLLATVVIISWLSYLGIWKFYKLFCSIYPKNHKLLSLGTLFIPSVAFWGSGILKDTFTLTATVWYTYNFYFVFIKKEKITANIILLLFNSFLLISIKPYIFIALIPGSIIWLSYNWITSIKNKIFRFTAAPVLFATGILIGAGLITILSGSLGKYSSTKKIIKKAQVTQQDLIRTEQYGKNHYNIGKFDDSFSGVISKAPDALFTGLFRPFIWEANNPVMLLSGFENLIFLVLTVGLFIYVGPIRLIKFIMKDPLLFFSLTFSIVFAFSVGITTANYGALVRYRIPALPFFINGLVIIYCYYIDEKKRKLIQDK